MKFFIKKNYIILSLLVLLLIESNVYARENKTQYTKGNISNYFSGIISINNNYDNEAFKYLKKVKSLKKSHSRFNIEFVKSLVSIEKFDQAFSFSKNKLLSSFL